MKAQTPKKSRTAKSPTEYLCPGCGIGFCADSIGGLYGLHFIDSDDIFYVAICKRCASSLHVETVRLKIRQRFESCVIDRDLNTRFAITTRKILAIYNHDIREALENGWPFEKPGHFYDVYELPTGVFVFERVDGSC